MGDPRTELGNLSTKENPSTENQNPSTENLRTENR
jgi:hypothetical protein